MKYCPSFMLTAWLLGEPGPWFNIKMSSYQYREYHCGDKTVVRPSYLHNGISCTGKTTSLYWIRASLQSVYELIIIYFWNIYLIKLGFYWSTEVTNLQILSQQGCCIVWQLVTQLHDDILRIFGKDFAYELINCLWNCIYDILHGITCVSRFCSVILSYLSIWI